MNKLIVIALTSLFATASFAASPSLLSALMKSDAVKGLTSITKVEVVQTYRCMGCFDIKLTGSNPIGAASMTVNTRLSGPNKLEVKVLSQTK